MALGSILNAQTRGSVLDSIAHPNVLNPAAAIGSAATAADAIWRVRGAQAEQAWGNALQQATDPKTGVVDYQTAARIAATMPEAAPAMRQGLTTASGLSNEQLNRSIALHGFVGSSAASLMLNPSDENLEKIRSDLTASNLPPSMVNPEMDRIKALRLPNGDPDLDARRAEAYKYNLAAIDAQGRLARGGFGAPTLTDSGAVMQPTYSIPASPWTAPGVATAPGAIPKTIAPDVAAQPVHYKDENG